MSSLRPALFLSNQSNPLQNPIGAKDKLPESTRDSTPTTAACTLSGTDGGSPRPSIAPTWWSECERSDGSGFLLVDVAKMAARKLADY
jgi:hypothetical protein